MAFDHAQTAGKRVALLLIGGAALLGLALALVSAAYYRNQRAADFRQAQFTLQAIADLKAQQIAAWRTHLREEAEFIEGHRPFARFFRRLLGGAPGARAELEEWMAPHLGEKPSWNPPVVLDARLRVVVSSGSAEDDTLGERGRKVAAAALAGGRTVFADLHRKRPDGPLHLDLAVPIAAGGEAPIGLLFFRIDPAAELLPLLKRFPAMSPTTEVLLVWQEGESVHILGGDRNRQGEEGERRALSEAGLAEAAAARGEEGAFAGGDYRGVPVIAALRSVPDSPWRLVAKVDREEVEAPLRRLMAVTVAVSALLFVAAAGVVGAFWERRWRREALRLLAVEQEGRAAAERAAALLRHANDGILLADDRLRIVEANPRLEELSGYPRAELLGMSVTELRAEAARADLDETLERARARGGGIYETRHRRRDGSEYPVEVSVRIFEEGGRRRLLAHVRDVSERHRSEERIRALNSDLERRVVERTAALEEANRELESFSYSVSHDLRAPLRAIEGFAQILREEHGTGLDPEARRLLDVVSANARRMARLIDDLLAFSRIGRAGLSAGRVDMTGLAREVFEELCPPAARGRVDLALGELPPSRGDAALLRQVWVNLIGNALKFTATRARARIDVAGRREGAEAVYEVRDNGVGFDMRYADKLFGVFQRLHGLDRFEGTGVGLAIVQSVVHRHAGRVWAQGTPDAGATFGFALPGADGDDPA